MHILGKNSFSNQVVNYFDDLILILFHKDYFSYSENAKLYIDKIVAFIYDSVGKFPHKTTPKELKYLGSNYIFYKANSRTVWYVFFENKDKKYLITGILNSHSEEAKYL